MANTLLQGGGLDGGGGGGSHHVDAGYTQDGGRFGVVPGLMRAGSRL